MPENNENMGELQINVTSTIGLIPIANATINISYTGIPENVVENLSTDISGQSEVIELSAPPLEYSLQPSEPQPYTEYTIEVSAPGYETVTMDHLLMLLHQIIG